MITDRARKLRQNQTDVEKTLWLHLRNRQLNGSKFYRQFPIPPYTVDFCCRTADLIIELDGSQHAENQQDQKRAEFLQNKGYTILRFWNNEVSDNLEGVLEVIARKLEALSLKGEVCISAINKPLPSGRGRPVKAESEDGRVRVIKKRIPPNASLRGAIATRQSRMLPLSSGLLRPYYNRVSQ